MRWRRVGPGDESALRAFLSAREARCAAAAARFRELAACGFGPGAPGTAWAGFRTRTERAGEPGALVVVSRAGVASVVLDDPADPENLSALARILARRRISSLQGCADDVRAAERARARSLFPFSAPPASEPIDYTLMRLEGEPRREALAAGPPGSAILRASEADAELLFPLQAAYELEEVVPPGGAFNPAAARLAFERTLRERIVLYAAVGGRAVGKAGTNARGYAYDQLGGVYVEPEFRGRGIATRLTAELCALLRSQGRKIVLFVKKRNAGARKAYERAGFVPDADYRITYYTEAGR